MGLPRLWNLLVLLLFTITTTVGTAGTTTVPPLTTSPGPIPPGFCGTFDNETDGWTTEYWNWSTMGEPDFTKAPKFNWTSGYMWTQNTAGGLLVSPKVKVSSDAEYSFDYYVYLETAGLNNKMTIYFQPLDSATMYTLKLLVDSTDRWQSYNGICSPAFPCCPSYPCDGQFYIGSAISEGNGLFAVDNVEMENGCAKTRTSR